MTEFLQTPSQTVGPFFGFALPYAGGPELVSPARPDAVRVHGTLLDGGGAPIPDGLLEIWQPDGAGAVARRAGSLHRDGYTFTGFGRAATDRAGDYTFTTVKPGAVGDAAPHIVMAIFARGLLHHLYTRIYFPEDAAAHGNDAVLTAVPPQRRGSMIAEADGDGSYRFDIRLQGDDETVFLDYSR